MPLKLPPVSVMLNQAQMPLLLAVLLVKAQLVTASDLPAPSMPPPSLAVLPVKLPPEMVIVL